MELFQKTLTEAIDKNASETAKWEKYLEEMGQAESNLRDFQKKLQVECMVPVGTKALMPGYLYHTSEILVANGSKIFSKCTTFEALKICKHRQKYAEERLEALRTERDLHKNKLELPFMQNAFGNQGQEIIEEYDEEKEREWREKHKASVAKQKKEEREAREREQKVEKTHDDVMNLLDELELMDELAQELESLDVKTDEQLRGLMSGEIKPPPEKKRVSHYENNEKIDINRDKIDKNCEKIDKNRENVERNTENESPIVQNPAPIPPPLNDIPPVAIPEPESPPDEGNFTGESNSESESDVDSTTVSEQVWSKWQKILEESKNFNRKEKLRYLKRKMKDVQISLRELIVHDVDTLTTKIDLNDLKDLLEDEMIRLDGFENETETAVVAPETKPTKRKSRISFASEDDIKLINKFDEPCKVSASNSKTGVCLLESKIDLTRHIKFHHSEWPPMEPCKAEENEIASPCDFYTERFGYFPKKVETIEESRVNTSLPSSTETSCEDLKSILKNKEKVLQETHVELPVVAEKPVKKEKKVRKPKQVTNLLGDVVERPVEYETKSKTKDETSQSSTTKISKFKASRSKNKS